MAYEAYAMVYLSRRGLSGLFLSLNHIFVKLLTVVT